MSGIKNECFIMKKKEYKQILSRFSELVFGDFGQFWLGFLYKLAKSACILAFACIPAVPLGCLGMKWQRIRNPGPRGGQPRPLKSLIRT